MKLWDGRFTKGTNQLVHNFNESFSFNQKFCCQDVRGSIVHVKMLAKQGILTGQDRDDIIHGLENILKDLDNRKLVISSDSRYEDVHSFVEGTLTGRIGEVGKRLYTGRSRSDQVTPDMEFYTRDEVDTIEALVKGLLEELLTVMEKDTDTLIPGFTHLQKAQPTTLVHYMGTYFEMPFRDCSYLKGIHRHMNYRPLGSGTLVDTTYPLGREYTAEFLGLDGLTPNSIDSVAGRDYPIELFSTLSIISMHLSRLCEEITVWNTSEYHFAEVDDSYNIGSSIMPQKRSPDIAELIRGKSGRVYGALASVLTTMRGIPLAYNKDMQGDKELTSDAVNTVKGCLALFTGMIFFMSFRKEVIEVGAKSGFTNATGVADYLTDKGVPFRDAHGIVGQLVLACIAKGIALDDFSLEEYRAISPMFEENTYEAISMKTCVEKRLTIEVPGQKAMKEVIRIYKKQLDMGDVR